VSTAHQYQTTAEVPETQIEDYTSAGMGYGESKLVSENILAEAAKNGVRASICRVGQISGPIERGVQGMWNMQEWLPTVCPLLNFIVFIVQILYMFISWSHQMQIVISSARMGLLPSTLANLNTIDWIPVDILSKIIVELAMPSNSATSEAQFFHTVNPHITTWDNLLPAIEARLNATTGKKVDNVPWSQWVDAIRKAARNHGIDEDILPGIKLLDFYEAVDNGKVPVVFETVKTQKASSELRRLTAVDKDAMVLWMKQWGLWGMLVGTSLWRPCQL
jgi:hypothetical protein